MVPKPGPNVAGLLVDAVGLKLNVGAVAVLDVLVPKPPKLNAGVAIVVAVVPKPPKAGAAAVVVTDPKPPNAGAVDAGAVPNPPIVGAAVELPPKPPNPPVDSEVDAGPPNENGATVAAGAAVGAVPNEYPGAEAVNVFPKLPKGAAVVAPNPVIVVVVKPGVVKEKAGAFDAAFG